MEAKYSNSGGNVSEKKKKSISATSDLKEYYHGKKKETAGVVLCLRMEDNLL